MVNLVRITDPTDIRLQKLISLYEEAFPEEERRKIKQLKRLISERSEMYFNAIETDGILAGLFIYWDMQDFYYLEHLAVFTPMPSEEDTLRQSLCPTPGDYRDFRVFRGYLDQSMWKLDPVIGTMACPVCGTALQPDDVWLKKGSSGWYTLSQCPVCKGRGGEAGRGVFQKYRMSRRDGLHWAFARCVQMPDDASLVRWKKQKAQYLERQRLKAERQAAEAEAARHIF